MTLSSCKIVRCLLRCDEFTEGLIERVLTGDLGMEREQVKVIQTCKEFKRCDELKLMELPAKRRIRNLQRDKMMAAKGRLPR